MNRQPDNLESGDILYENKYQRIKMINPNYPFVHIKGNGAVAVPYDTSGNIYLIRKNRRNIGMYYELPRGFVEEHESCLEGAVRELKEETGLEAIETLELGEVQPDTGLLNNRVEMIGILVEEQKTNKYQHTDEVDNETNEVYKLSIEEVFKLIDQGRIICGYTMSGIIKLQILRNKFNK